MTKKQFIIGALLIALLHIGLVICFGIQKQGFHEDEYYTYWSVSSNSESLVPSNMSWHSGQELQSRFFVRAGERFSFDRVIQNQAEDVHPPLYYLALHVFMSLFANHFYKWFGILLNLVFSLITYVGILLVFLQIQGENARYRKELALFTGFIYSILPSVISAVMLTRMYAMSTMWTAAYTLVFVLLFRYQDCGKKQFAGLVLSGAFICYCAFLTHYYALFVPFFLTVFYVLYTLIRRKGIVRMLVYGICMLVAISQAVLTYPACLSHIFGGYRGRDAISGFLAGTLFDRTAPFAGWINSSVFAGWMFPCLIGFLLCAVVGVICFAGGKKEQAEKRFVYQMFSIGGSCLFSFFVLTKLALMVGEDASRYFYPVVNLAIPFMAYTAAAVVMALQEKYQSRTGKRLWQGLAAVLAVLVLFPVLHTYQQGKVLFLYKEDGAKKAFSESHREYPLVLVYSRDKSYRSWYVDDQVWPFERVLYVDVDSLQQIEDSTLSEAEKVVVFMDAPEEYLQHMIDNNPNLSTYTLVRHDAYFYVYLLE